MSSPAAIRPARTPITLILVAFGVAAGAAALVWRGETALEATYVVFITLAGLAMGSLLLLMIGHLMSEDWLAPVRSEAEAAALTMPLLFLVGIPLAFGLDQIFPWSAGRVEMPPARSAFLSPAFFLARSTAYIAIASVVALWLARTRHKRRASAIGLAVLTPVVTFSAYDWVLSRDPKWWSSLFGFAFAFSQVLAALAIAILITLLKPEHPAPRRMVSLERALLTSALLVTWTWFAQFLIVWLANLPEEAVWYLDRADPISALSMGVAIAAMLLAIIILVPTGVSRWLMIAGSILVLVQHGATMFWILQPGRPLSWLDGGLALFMAAIWIVTCASIMRRRPSYAEETSSDP